MLPLSAWSATANHVFFNSEKWSNSARFHGVGFTARLLAAVCIYLSAIWVEKLNYFLSASPTKLPDCTLEPFENGSRASVYLSRLLGKTLTGLLLIFVNRPITPIQIGS